MLKIIKQRGEINHCNSSGITPLMATFEECHSTYLIESLLYAHANFTVKDNDGLSPLGHAIKANNRQGIQCFRQFIADKMIRYSFRDDKRFAITEGRNTLLDLFEPIIYQYEVELILRSSKKIEVFINDTFTYGELVKHFEEETKNKSDEFYKGNGFAVRPKDISSIRILR